MRHDARVAYVAGKGERGWLACGNCLLFLFVPKMADEFRFASKSSRVASRYFCMTAKKKQFTYSMIRCVPIWSEAGSELQLNVPWDRSDDIEETENGNGRNGRMPWDSPHYALHGAEL